jgi:hypothetical protein
MQPNFRGLCLRIAPLVVVGALSCGSRTDGPSEGGTAATGGSGGAGGNAGSSVGGTGGNAGAATGGTGGTGGTAGTGTGGSGGITPGDSGVCGCVTGHVGWGMDGGLVFYTETSALEVCNLFTHQRTFRAPDPPGLFCEQQLTDCAGKFSPGDVTRAIAHADVKAAIAAAPVLYGEDPRAYDGQVLRIQLQSAIIEVGLPCRTMAGCKPIPAGVDALANLLQSVTKQELAREPCKSAFPSTL